MELYVDPDAKITQRPMPRWRVFLSNIERRCRGFRRVLVRRSLCASLAPFIDESGIDR